MRKSTTTKDRTLRNRSVRLDSLQILEKDYVDLLNAVSNVIDTCLAVWKPVDFESLKITLKRAETIQRELERREVIDVLTAMQTKPFPKLHPGVVAS